MKFEKDNDALQAVHSLQDYDLYGRKVRVEVSKRAQPRRKTPGRYAGFVARRSRSRSYRRRGRSSSSESYSSRSRRGRRYR